MRANIPPRSSRPSSTELTGPYLHAMQEISARLMDALPAGDDLWRTLGQAEALLLEAQMQGTSPQKIFGSGGVEAFCRSIVEEYEADRRAEPTKGNATYVPASADRSFGRSKSRREPRGGVNYRKKRYLTVGLSVVICLLLVCSVCLYTGLWRYWTGGTSYYLEELYNFQNTVTDATATPMTFTVPMKTTGEMSYILYADEDGNTITLAEVGRQEYIRAVKIESDGETQYERMQSWYIRMLYTVSSDFSTITYVEPDSHGTATVTLADGSVYTGEIGWESSGASSDGYEYARITVIELPAEVDMTGASLSIQMGAPNRVVWERISTGPR